jgi:hypothetical protein
MKSMGTEFENTHAEKTGLRKENHNMLDVQNILEVVTWQLGS